MHEYIPSELKEKLDNPDYPLLYDFLDETLFHITNWDEEVIKTAQCAICKGTQFNIGQANYTTAIRCVTCGWEEIIHNG